MKTVAGADTSRPVAAITIYPHCRDFPGAFDLSACKGTPEQYRQALRDAFAKCDLPNLHLIEGPEILTDAIGLTTDLVHPADAGMIQMGENLARRLEPIVAPLRN
jgi:lysophospholipase L1-like esterase